MTISRNPKDVVAGALIVLSHTKEILCLVLDNVKTEQRDLRICDGTTSFIGLSAKSGIKVKYFLQSFKGRVYDFLIYSPDHDEENSK